MVVLDGNNGHNNTTKSTVLKGVFNVDKEKRDIEGKTGVQSASQTINTINGMLKKEEVLRGKTDNEKVNTKTSEVTLQDKIVTSSHHNVKKVVKTTKYQEKVEIKKEPYNQIVDGNNYKERYYEMLNPKKRFRRYKTILEQEFFYMYKQKDKILSSKRNVSSYEKELRHFCQRELNYWYKNLSFATIPIFKPLQEIQGVYTIKRIKMSYESVGHAISVSEMIERSLAILYAQMDDDVFKDVFSNELFSVKIDNVKVLKTKSYIKKSINEFDVYIYEWDFLFSHTKKK